MRDRSGELRRAKRYSEAIETAEAFIRWARESKHPNPRTKWFITSVQGINLLQTYHEMGEMERLDVVLADATETLLQYPAEWDVAMAEITDDSEGTRKRLEAKYREVVFYPEDAKTVAEIREWLNQLYYVSIASAADNLSVPCSRVGRGEAAIDFLNRLAEAVRGRNNRLDRLLNLLLAALMLTVRNDRDGSLEHFKQSTAFGPHRLKRHLEDDPAFESVRNDPEFLAVVNAAVVGE